MRNPFRNAEMRRYFDQYVEMYRDGKMRNADGTPSHGGSTRSMFWRGYRGIPHHMGLALTGHGTIGYAAFRAGHEINKAESKKLRSENLCVFCGEDTAFGSGRFVNRIPADTYHELDDGTEEYRDGYACAECMASECGRCDEEIPLDEDYSVDNGHTRLHWDCLTDQEKAICDRDVYDWERLTDKEKEADSNSD